MKPSQRVGEQSKASPPSPTFASTKTAQRESISRTDLLQGFEPIRLSEMDHVALFRRTDTKYILSEAQLFQAFANLAESYQILEIDGSRLQHYRTLYFDTANLALYRQHHDGCRDRYKVRQRAYVDSGLAFLEIKRKTNANMTIKSRRQTQILSTVIGQDASSFLRSHYPYRVEELEAKLLNTFRRITLVSTRSVERLTVDVGLRFLWNDVHVSLDGLAIAEVKQNGFSIDSEFVQQMRTLGVRPTSFSKYCIGVSMLYPEIKHNRFNPQLCRIAQLLHERETVCPTCSYY